VTCTHFWPEHTPTEPPYEAIVQNIRERTVLARVSSKMFSRRLGNVGWTFENVTRRNAKTFVSVIGTDDVLVELVSENKEADMAIFRTRGKPHSHFVKRGDLYSLEHSCTDLPSAIWSVGYNGNDMPIEQVPLHQDLSQKAAAMKPKPTTAFEYIIRLYEQSLMKSNGWLRHLMALQGMARYDML